MNKHLWNSDTSWGCVPAAATTTTTTTTPAPRRPRPTLALTTLTTLAHLTTILLLLLLAPGPGGALDPGIDLLDALSLHTNLSQYQGVTSETLCPHRVAQLSVTASAHKSINGNAMTSFRAVVAAATASGQARNPCRVTVSSDRPPGLVIRQRFSSNPLNGCSCERERESVKRVPQRYPKRSNEQSLNVMLSREA
ncbi:hypothetical protein quinque_005937 [Culex quinquefasciatus]